MYCTIRFIVCHPVSPREERHRVENGKVRGKSKEKHRIKGVEKDGHTRMASPRARKNGRNGGVDSGKR